MLKGLLSLSLYNSPSSLRLETAAGWHFHDFQIAGLTEERLVFVPKGGGAGLLRGGGFEGMM